MKYLVTLSISILRFLEFFLLFVSFYFLSGFWLSRIAVNRGALQPMRGVEIFIESNGVHTGFLFPARTTTMNWTNLFPYSDFQAVDSSFKSISIGWGDRSYYLYTPTWADLTFSIAFKATFGLDSAAMHVEYHKEVPVPGKWIKRLMLSESSYEKLIAYILANFKTKDGKFLRIIGHTYGTNDCFYEAKGTFSLFKDCNVWTNEGLKSVGVQTGLWCPFEEGVRRWL